MKAEVRSWGEVVGSPEKATGQYREVELTETHRKTRRHTAKTPEVASTRSYT